MPDSPFSGEIPSLGDIDRPGFLFLVGYEFHPEHQSGGNKAQGNMDPRPPQASEVGNEVAKEGGGAGEFGVPGGQQACDICS